MDQVGQDRASLDVTTPFRRVIIVILARCPQTADRHQPADAPALDDLPCRPGAGVIATLMADKDLATLRRRMARHLVGLFHRGGDRLFDQNRLAMVEGRHHIGVVAFGRGGNDHRLDIRGGQHAVGIGEDRNPARLTKRCRGRRRVCNRDKIDMRHLVDGLDVAGPNRTGADQSNSENVHQLFAILYS